MEEEEKADDKPVQSFFAALYTEPTLDGVVELAEVLGKKSSFFASRTLPTTAVVILLGNSLCCIQKDFTSSQRVIIGRLTHQILRYCLSLLEECDKHYLPIFRLIHSMCSNERQNCRMQMEELVCLREIIKQNEKSLESMAKDTGSDEMETDTFDTSSRKDSKSDTRAEMQKLFSQIKSTTRKKAASVPVVHYELPSTPEPPGRDFFKRNYAQLNELGGVQSMVEYCLRLPIFATFKEKKLEFMTSLTAPEQKDRLMELINAIEAVTIVSYHSPLSSDTLATLVRQSLASSTTAVCQLNTLAMTKQKVVSSDLSSEQIIAPQNIQELFNQLTSCHLPKTTADITYLINQVVTILCELIQRIEVLLANRPKGSDQTFATLVAYHVLSGLKPLCVTSSKGSEPSYGKITLGQTKFTVALGRLALLGIENLSHILPNKANQESIKLNLPQLMESDLDIDSTYDNSQLVQLLMNNVPLISLILSIAQSTFKKYVALLGAPSQDGSQTELKTEESTKTIEPRSDEDQLFLSRLKDSLSSKISEALSKSVEGDKSPGTSSVSPSSTVSSSGDVQGEYVVNPPPDVQQEDQVRPFELTDSDYIEEMIAGPLLLHYAQAMATPAPVPPPPPPPIPPKRTRFAKQDIPIIPDPLLPPRGPTEYEIVGPKRKTELYQKISLRALKIILHDIVQNPSEEIQSVLSNSITPDHLSCLTCLFFNIQKLSEDDSQQSYQEFNVIMNELMHDLISVGAVSMEDHGVLLRDLGLNYSCWPLIPTTSILSLLARVLIIRSEREDDPLSINIWKGFLSTLEENAANENESDEDLPVIHLQLLLFVWHNFSENTRKSLLLQCLSSINRVAEEKKAGVLVPPLASCRLLLVFHYMLFQFNEMVPELAEQIKSNLLMGSERSISPASLFSSSYEGIMCYPCDQNVQYNRVITKPGIISEKKKMQVGYPLFYSVVPPRNANGGSNEEKLIDPDACKILLNAVASGDAGSVKGYDQIHASLITLMSCGTDYHLYSDNFHHRIIAVCAGHQCMDLCLHILTCLPPSHAVMDAIVSSAGLSCKESNGSCLLILSSIFSVKFRLQQVDSEDIIDTLTESGYPSDVAEELTALVMSLVGSIDHFISLAKKMLEELCEVEDDKLPMMSLMAVNLVICLLHRTLLANTEPTADDVGTDETDKDKEPNSSSTEDSGDQLKLKFYQTHSDTLIPILLNVIRKLLFLSHHFICRCYNDSSPEQHISDDMVEVINKILDISGVDVKPQNASLFIRHIPPSMAERLKTWNFTPLLQITEIEDSFNVQDFFNFLNICFKSYCGTATYSSCQLLKTTLLTSTNLLASILKLNPEEGIKYLPDVVPLGTDTMMEFTMKEVRDSSNITVSNSYPMKRIANMFGSKVFHHDCIRHKVLESFKLVQLSQLAGHSFQGDLLEDMFLLLSQLLDSSSHWSILSSLDENTNLIDLLLLCSISSLSSQCLTRGLNLILSILEQTEKSIQEHLTSLCGQIATLALVPTDKLNLLLRRIVLGCLNDSSSDVVAHTVLLCHIVRCLTKDDCLVPYHVCQPLLSGLLSLGSELVGSLVHTETKLLTVFRDFFQSCVLLAGKQNDKGHYQLVSASSQWLPTCTDIVKSSVNRWKHSDEILIPVSSILSYIADVISAVQLLTNEQLCNERRNLANEDDYSVLIEEEEEPADTEEDYQDSEEEGLNDKLCTFTETKREFRNQHWYHCHTCKLTEGTGCCSVCVKVCHKGHDVTYSKLGSFFCDCGAKEDGSCKCLVKRVSKAIDEGRVGSPLPGEGLGSYYSEERQRKRRKRKSRMKKTESTDKKSTKRSLEEKSVKFFPSSFILKLTHEIETYKESLQQFFLSPSIAKCSMDVLNLTLPHVITSANELAMGGSSDVQDVLTKLHTCDKKVDHVDNIMTSNVICQENAIDNVKLVLSGDQSQFIKQLLTNEAITRSAATCMYSMHHQHLAISQDKGKIMLLQLSSLLKQVEGNRRKLAISRVSSVLAPFTIMSLCGNPCNEEFLAVSGIKECQVMSINSSGHVTDRINLHPSVDSTNGYIVKAIWLPGSQTELAIITDTFVKIYDLSVDSLSPVYYFIVCSDKIRDATFVITEESKNVLVMMSTGHIFCQPIIPECNASDGPIYFTVEFSLSHSSIEEHNSQVCDGGASIYYSHSLHMLFFSYQNGKSFMATLDDTTCKAHQITELVLKNNTTTTNDKTTPAPLINWKDVPNHPGLILALTGITHNPVILLVKPETVQIQELKALPAKSKIQGAVMIRQQPGTGDSYAASRTALVTISEDGSLRVHYCNENVNTAYWFKHQFQPATPLAYLTQPIKKPAKTKKKHSPPKFPVDFFEHCTRMQNSELEFGGSDVLHVYNKEQVKQRLNVGGLYIANTKPGGFTIDVTNLQSDTTVMVGVRVLLGCRSLERTPSYIEVFGRKQEVTFPGGIARWFDVPFSREESLQADKKCQIIFGPSMDSSAINIVDCVRAYVKTKLVFGWPERPTAARLALGGGTSLGGDHEDLEKEVIHVSETHQLSSIDWLMCNVFSVLGNSCIASPSSVDLSSIVNVATPLLNLTTPLRLQYHTRFLLSSIVKQPSLYHTCKDHLQLSLVNLTLTDEVLSDVISPELYQHLLLLVLVVSRTRPQHLSMISSPVKGTLADCLKDGDELSVDKELKTCDDDKDAIERWTLLMDKLNELFWNFYQKKSRNVNITSICNTGMVAVEMTVNVLVEIMWTISVHFPDILSTCTGHWIKLLTADDFQISSACVKSLMKLLKPCSPPEQTATTTNTTTTTTATATTTTATATATTATGTGDEPSTEEQQDSVPIPVQEPVVPEEPAQQQDPLSHMNIEVALANPAMAMEQLMANPGLLGYIPDEEAMMNFAIAISLQEEGNEGGAAEAMQNALQNLNMQDRSVSPQILLDENPPDPDQDENEDDMVHVQRVLHHQGDIVDSLHSSYEDISPSNAVVHVISKPDDEGATPRGGEPAKKDKGTTEGQEANSEPDNANDSSGEEDAEDSSFLDIYEQFDKVTSEVSIAEEVESKDRKSQSVDEATTASKEHKLRLSLLNALSEHLPLVEDVGGTRGIPYMQILLFLCGYLENSQNDEQTFNNLLKSLTNRLKLSDGDVSVMMSRGHRSEVLLLYLRFLNIIMSRKRIRSEKSEVISAGRLWNSTATLLLNCDCVSFCLKILKGLLNNKNNFQLEQLSSTNAKGLLKPRTQTTLLDMGPFFQKQYVKNHSSDVFETYIVLLADIALALPCQLKKFCEKTSVAAPLEFDSEWMETLCEYFMVTSNLSGSNKKQIRKVLIFVCGSKDNYRLTRDKYALQTYTNNIRDMCSSSHFDPNDPSSTLLHVSYGTLLKMIEQLRMCDEVARTRTKNWQLFCLEEKKILPFLLIISLTINEGLSPTLLQLLCSAISGQHPSIKKQSDSSGDNESKAKSKDKTKSSSNDKQENVVINEEMNQSLCQLLFEAISDDSFELFLNRFLLQSNESSVRWQVHSFVYSLYKYSPSTQKVHLVQLLWKLWSSIPKYGHKASQYIDLLGYCTITTPEVLQKDNMCQYFVDEAFKLLRKQNILISAHPNCHVYSQLASLVDFSGYYLESEPCLVCNDPEIPLTIKKLFSIKSEVRYSANTIFIKLDGSYLITQLQMRISEVRRSKMIRTINFYYSNRTVNNVIELKNNRSLWSKACSCTLQHSQTELKFEFPLPVVARNVILEFADFYENSQVGLEVLQCPRCNASVPANPGVCSACGENAHQCQKCRTINYDERNPFLCISCGFSKYARFETSIEGRSCSAVDPIESEEDRQKTLLSINQLLEKADSVYKQLIQHCNELDQLLVALASGPVASSQFGSSSESGVNRAIQAAAHLYCTSCKGIYNELSKIIQNVLASRKELVTYDLKKLQSGKATPSSEPATPITPGPDETHSFPSSLPLSAAPLSDGDCFGCASATLEHCITILKALAYKKETRQLMKENVIEELMEFNLRSGSNTLQNDVQGLLCQLTRDNFEATRNLNEFIMQRVLQSIKPQRTSPNLASVIQAEMRLLTASVSMEDTCWEERLRTVMRLFRKSRCHASPVVMATVTMPCLKILQLLINPIHTKKTTEKMIEPSGIPANINSWLKDGSGISFDKWKNQFSERTTRDEMLTRKYLQIWMDKALKSRNKMSVADTLLKQTSWLRNMLFNKSSRAARKMACNILLSLCRGDQRWRQILDLLSSFLDEVCCAGEASQEFLELFQKLLVDKSGRWKLYLSKRGILVHIGTLVGKEISHLCRLEESTLSSDLSQGYALEMLTTLLKSFLEVESIKQCYKNQLVGLVLNGYLSLKRLVIQRTKHVDESQKVLLHMLETLTSGTTQEKQELMSICVEILSNYPMHDHVTPIFVFEQLCNIIHPEEEDVGEFYLQLEKDPQQEEFLQGRMQGNPYSSKDPGLGPLMRDVKNKICTDCELVALLEDDTGMELLVCNKIISLDLPVKEVYKKIWCAQDNHNDRMKVVYRMRGLLGDATEDMVETLNDNKDEDIDEEEVFKMAAVLGQCNRLDAILLRLSHARHFMRSHGMIKAGLKLLGYCVKVKTNRQYLIQSHLNTLKILLNILNMALEHEQIESSGIGATVAQQVLSVTEPILQESSIQQRVIVRSMSDELTVVESSEEHTTLQMLLKHIESPFVQSNLGVREGLMHIIPFLTFGDPLNMTVLLQHFAPYLDFERFDNEKTPEHSLYLDCFSVVATGIGTDASGEKLKDLLIEMKLTPSSIDYIINRTPSRGSGRFDTPEWEVYLSSPSLPYVLKILTGLCQHHAKTQLMVSESIPQVHLLEQVSSTENSIGTLAEKLLEALRANPECDQKIQDVRKATRAEKKRKAMEMRAKELGALGFQMNEKGQVVAETPTAFKEIESEVVEETGLQCCICLEGYRNQPQKVLGVYTFTRKVVLDEFENKPRKTVGYGTVSHFNVVHFDCHSSAVKLARGRNEWESATLQNANTRCNGLLPIWGPEVSDSVFANALARHNSYLQEYTGLYDPSFRSYSHDLRLLLLRFAHETSFSAESGGGGPQSNLHLIPYLIHVVLYVIDTTRVYQREERNLNNFLILTRDKWISSAYEVENSLHYAVITIFLLSLPQWEENKVTVLSQLLVLSHARKASSSPIKSLPTNEVGAYADYKPVLIFFGLIDAFHRLLKKSITVTGSELPQAVLSYIRTNDKAINEGCEKILAQYQDELLPVESFDEFCDVMGLLSVIQQPSAFLKELVTSVAASV